MPLPAGPLTVVILAAGEGTRMRSSLPKVLHAFAGRSMLAHVLASVLPTRPDMIGVVVGHESAQVRSHLASLNTEQPIVAVEQAERLGTGHAVRIALQALHPEGSAGTVLVMPADAPLVRASTVADLLSAHAESGAAITLLSSEVADPTGYGRVIRAPAGSSGPAAKATANIVEQIVEHRDASAEQLAVKEVSALIYAFDAALLRDALGRLSTDNAQHEQYLPDVVAILGADGHTTRAVLAPADEVAGVNDRVQLAAARRVMNDRLITAHMLAGVTVIDPATVWVDVTVQLEPDVTLRPGVELFGATTVATGSEIGPDTTLTDTMVGSDCRLQRVVANGAAVGSGVSVGPYAYLRPGTVLADHVHIGTFVELKNSDVGVGSKVPHLSYVGDASIGVATNIGAATVFVNYDGANKHRSRIGDHARTGADNMFVAPVTVGDGAYTAAGSVITDDVPPGALAVARAAQRNVENWVVRKRPGTKSAQAAQQHDSSDNRPRGEEPTP